MATCMRIEAPHFVAGVVFDDRGAIMHVAPILSWMKREGVNIVQARAWCERRRYARQETILTKTQARSVAV